MNHHCTSKRDVLRRLLFGGGVLLGAWLCLLAPARVARADGADGGASLFGVPSDEGAAQAAHAAQAPPPPAPGAPQAGDEPEGSRHAHRAPTPPAAPAPDVVPPAAPLPPLPGEEDERGPDVVRIDTTFTVRAGMRLVVKNFGGDVSVRTWDRSQVRLQAERDRRDRIRIARDGNTLGFASVSLEGVPRPIDFRLTIPTWMAFGCSGVHTDVNLEGLSGGVNVETVHGRIVARRLAGDVTLRSVEGGVEVRDVKGNLKLSSVNDLVRVSEAQGDVAAEAVNGDIVLVDLAGRNVEGTTINGTVLFDGPLRDDGTYRLASHSGDVALGLSEKANATVLVSTFDGEFESAFPVRLKRAPEGRRFTFTLGSGKAQLDLESFAGAIQLFRPGDAGLKALLAGERPGPRPGDDTAPRADASGRSREVRVIIKETHQGER